MRRPQRRLPSGATMPFVIFSFAVTIAMLAIAVDIMRTIYCTSILQNSAQSAGLYALRQAFNDDGEMKAGQPDSNIVDGLNTINGGSGSAWFAAPAGPSDDGTHGQTPVFFQAGDVTVTNAGNGNNAGDLLLTVKARRDGADALKLKFLPLIYAFGSLPGVSVPSGVDLANPYRVAEICLQPATRIGAGEANNSTLLRSNFANQRICASFPLALSNVQWQAAAQPAQTNLLYTIKIAGSKSGNSASSANEISGCFVNLTPSGDANYYGGAAGNLSVSQLYDNLAAFSGDSPSAPSAAVERDSHVFAFDADAQEFTSRAQQIAARLNKLTTVQPNRFYTLPVIEQNPLVTQKNHVIGFSRMRLVKAVFDPTNNSISLQMEIGQSRPMANASVGTQLAAIPTTNGTAIQASTGTTLFTPRSFGQDGLAALPRGMVMAPALSPRSIAGGGI